MIKNMNGELRETGKGNTVPNSERILKLLEADIKLPQRYNLTMADLGLEDVTEEIDGTLRVMEKGTF